MKLLADENIDGPVVEHLRKAGHDVLYIAEAMSGTSDESVVGCANLQGRLLITADKDFGDILIRQRKISHGLLLLRLAGCSNSQKAAMVTGVIERHEGELSVSMGVITPKALRLRPLRKAQP
jgi:predicted nuclease of predicted toxin-antitoxin system